MRPVSLPWTKVFRYVSRIKSIPIRPQLCLHPRLIFHSRIQVRHSQRSDFPSIRVVVVSRSSLRTPLMSLNPCVARPSRIRRCGLQVLSLTTRTPLFTRSEAMF
ncbi:hypothetical protein DOTSEDRAFT_72066 [Dothistroma septosporum NZE10]|uniref:Uncharacterized protein n=1 Tax=Dothistroma septosporum (strain NZE10 / CBS 128990) TaxID=675120 RepID=N1PQ11_DOTSN|nr:hypothetical protein DOTSEDRAFT_72066 [Dothistroma septosporum NZE10]